MKTYEVGLVLTALLLATSAAFGAESQTVQAVSVTTRDYRTLGLGLCATLTMSLSVFGAAYAIARVGSAAMGAAAEKPELLTRSILFVALAEGLAVLGFVISIMLIQKL